jgi:hypothetical protein
MSARSKKVPYSFVPPPPGWIDKLPDGNYTIGRGADPRSAEEIASEATGNKQTSTMKRAKRRPPTPREAAE